MSTIFQIEERRLIPNWRNFKRTVELGELKFTDSRTPLKIINIDQSVMDWKYEKNIGTAADLINSSYVAGIIDKDETKEAIDFVFSNKDKSSEILLDLSETVKNEIYTGEHKISKEVLEIVYDSMEQFKSLINSKVLYRVINRTKNKTKDEILNPITWVELARLYSINGQIIKASNAIETALHLAPDNRFVLRSATRFFIHTGDFEKAIFFLKKSKSIKDDPWLISAHIATSSLMRRYSPLIKNGQSIITSDKFSNFELTELTSSLGTLEFSAGSFKNAKKLFHKSMLAPNDNSLAQMEWIAKDDPRFKINLFDFKDVVNSFEAFALDNFERGEWKDSFINCLKWFSDMPFSKRPILLGAYIAGSMLDDIDAAIVLCKIGLQANPGNVLLLNNIVYYFAMSGLIDDDNEYFIQFYHINFEDLPDHLKITLQATYGFLHFRTDNIELGKQYYEKAILNAQIAKNEYSQNSAIINYTRELILKNDFDMKKYYDIVKNMKIGKPHKDLEYLQSKILNLYDTKINNN
jgi:tetratricopeptide (TPR) repeat protein